MLSIGIYSDKPDDVAIMKSVIQDFLINYNLMAKLTVFTNPDEFITVPGSYDMYIMDMDSADDVIELGKQMMTIDVGSRFIYFCTDTNQAYRAAKARADYFLAKPIDEKEFYEVLEEIKQKIKDDNLIIKLSDGERRVRVNSLNYINIVKRCLCYHLTDGTMFDGQTLRTSFEKAISPLQHHKSKSFLFLPPSLLINIGEIKIVNGDNVVFENDDVLYIPKKAYDTVRDAWINYNRFVN